MLNSGFYSVEQMWCVLENESSEKLIFRTCGLYKVIHIDFAVMEKAPNVYVETVEFGWNDLGTWRSLYDHSPKNKDGNVTQNCKALMYNSHNSIVAVKGDKLVVASGLEGYIVADVDDALLIVPLEEEQKIKQYVNDMKSKFGDKYL